ncbi:MAG TPA: hypothetical protein VGQ86_08645 [Candidatus Limnocylindria bacterium]|nr:hypothetical protein [Candidatus Limnocylindria bacterium]
MAARRIEVAVSETSDGWVALVTITAATRTTHRVRISRSEHERYGGGDVTSLVRRSFEFLLDREPNTSILREFDLATIERYFPEYPTVVNSR